MTEQHQIDCAAGNHQFETRQTTGRETCVHCFVEFGFTLAKGPNFDNLLDDPALDAELYPNRVRTKAHVSLSGMTIRGINVLLEEEPDGRVMIRIDLHVPSRDTGAHLRTSTVTHTSANALMEDTIRETIRDVILTALGHEIDEWLSIDGVRVDPHGKR